MSSNEASPNSSPKAVKLTKKVFSFRAKKSEKNEPATPAYRFIVSMQGHGYPVPLLATTAPATAETAHGGAKSTILNLLKREQPKAAKAPETPAYRFISSMAGYGCPYPTEASVAAAKPAKPERHISLAKVPFVHEITNAFSSKSKVAPVTENTVPSYRFMVSMQGHGYPVPESTVATSPVTRRKTAGFLQMLKREDKEKAPKAAAAPVPETPATPAYRFISSMAGYGCPHPTTATPASESPKEKHHKSLLGGLGSVFKRASTPTLVAEKPAETEQPAPVAEEAAPVAAAEAPKAAPAPYRFAVSMQGHGYPVPESTVTAPASPKKKAKKSLFSSFMSFFKPKHQTVAAAGSA